MATNIMDLAGYVQQQGEMGRQMGQRNRIAELSQQAYGAPAEQRRALVGQAIGVDPSAGFALEGGLNKSEDARTKTLVNSAKLLTTAPEGYRASLYQQMKPELSRFGLQLPEMYDDTVAQAAQSIVAAYGDLDGSTPAGLREFQGMTKGLSPDDVMKARRVALGLDGRASSSGFSQVKFTGSDGRERIGVLNGKTGQIDLPDGTSFNPQTGAIAPTQGGMPAGAYQPAPSGGFGISETDNYVSRILGNAKVDPSATPEQQAEQLLPHVIQQESGGNPNAVSPKGAQGLMQVMPATGQDPGFGVTPLRSNDPQENVRFGREYLTAMLRRYPGRPDLALAAYNAGPGVADRFARPTAAGGGPLPPRLDYMNGGQFVGRAPEEQAALTTSAQEAAKLQFLPQQEAIQTRAAIERARQEAVIKNEADISGKDAARARSSDDTLSLLRQAEEIIPTSTGSGVGSIVDRGAAFFGKSNEGAEAIAALKTISGQLVAKMPRMEGPQSDKDVQMYKDMAGNLSDPATPRAQRIAALQMIRALNDRYASTPSAQASPVQRARNPQTGQVIELRNGQWVPVQ